MNSRILYSNHADSGCTEKIKKVKRRYMSKSTNDCTFVNEISNHKIPVQTFEKNHEIPFPEISYSRGKEKLNRSVQSYLLKFFSKFSSNKPEISAQQVKEDHITNNDVLVHNNHIITIRDSKRKKSRLPKAMIIQNNKVLLKRMINPPQKRVKNKTVMDSSPGFNCEDLSNRTEYFDKRKLFSYDFKDEIRPIDLKININTDSFQHLSKQSLDYISEEFNKPDKNIGALYLLLKKLTFFINYKPEIVKEIIKVSAYEKWEKGQVILKEGDIGTYIYVIISGAAILTKSIGMFKESTIINSAYDGDVIGEYSFIRRILEAKPSVREATCIATETCHLMKINNKEISEIIEAHIDCNNKYLKFLKDIPLFSSIPSIDLALLASTITVKQYNMDSRIISAGEVPENMCIVYRGRVKIRYPAKKIKYSSVLETVQFSTTNKELWISSGTFFGQRALLGVKTPANYSVYSDNIGYTSIIFISKQNFHQLFYPIQEHIIKLLDKFPQIDLKVPEEYDYI